MTFLPTSPPAVSGPYQILNSIGSGAFATVYRALHTKTGCVVALKAIAKRTLKSMRDFELLQREVNLMKTMDHPFIATFFEVLDDEDNFYLAIELVGNGSLLEYISANSGLEEPIARRIFAQLVSVLD
jgi:serine/threonine protein kinase